MDNQSSHEGPRAREMIEVTGAEPLYLQPYSPAFTPIDNAFAKLEALLRAKLRSGREVAESRRR